MIDWNPVFWNQEPTLFLIPGFYWEGYWEPLRDLIHFFFFFLHFDSDKGGSEDERFSPFFSCCLSRGRMLSPAFAFMQIWKKASLQTWIICQCTIFHKWLGNYHFRSKITVWRRFQMMWCHLRLYYINKKGFICP